MSIRELTLNRLKHPSSADLYGRFLDVYRKLFVQPKLLDEDKSKILEIAVLLTNQSEETMKRLGYRIALAYGNRTDDYAPLYDLALNTGLIPVAALLQKLGHSQRSGRREVRDTFLGNIIDSYIENFRSSGIVLTEQQQRLNQFFLENAENTCTVIAPTSYGKSELIISAIEQATNKRVCIIVPSKSLLSQTRKRVIDAKIGWVRRIVSHPEMHRPNDVESVYILTQERLSTILNQDKQMSFDIVIVDEAHNLLSGDERGELLASVIRILDFRNPDGAFKFLTPFLSDSSSINVRNTRYNSKAYRINEYVKSESIYLADFRIATSEVWLYDQFVNEFFSVPNESSDHLSYIVSNGVGKNVVYLNRPKHIQEFSLTLAEALPEIRSAQIDDAGSEIANSVNEEYHLLRCMKRGVLYHHGSMTEAVRGYVEHLFRSCNQIKYLVTNSTLLEGVNLPAQQMFLLSVGKGRANLSRSQFKNLIGRVSRFSDVFQSDDDEALHKLQPKIHVIASNRFTRPRANLQSFLDNVMRVNRKDEDTVENILLEGVVIDKRNQDSFDRAMTRLENLESGITGGTEYPVARTQVGLKLLASNIAEIDVFKYEQSIACILAQRADSGSRLSDSNALLSLIVDAFIAFIDADERDGRNNLLRLRSKEAQTFYAMFLDWRVARTPLPVMIQRIIRYWDQLPVDTPVFVGAWGDETKDNGHRPVFTKMAQKSYSEKVNLAIVRVKEEEDFFDHQIFRFVEILNELQLVEGEFYLLAKYGTTNRHIITLLKNGFSRGVAELLLENYSRYVTFVGEDGAAVNPTIHRRLQEDGVGFLQRNEVSLNVAAA